VDAHTKRIKGMKNVPLGSLGAYTWPEFAWFAS